MTMHYRATVSAGEGMDFVISDGSMDRHGTRINPNGWDLAEFQKNPIALWAHGTDPAWGRTPIGRWENVRVEGGKLVGRLIMAAEGTSARIDELRRLVEQGILRAVSVGMEYVKMGKPGGAWEIERQGLREVSLVPIGSNTNALSLARSLDISESTIRTVFGEHAEAGRRDVSTRGENAVTSPGNARSSAGLPSQSKVKAMKTLSQRIEDAQNELNAKRDRLSELTRADDLDNDALEAINGEISDLQRTVANLKASESSIGLGASPAGGSVAAPAVNRMPLGYRQQEVSGLDLLVRAMTVQGIMAFGPGNKSIDKILDERYPGHEATAVLCRADQTIGTTTVSGWASQLVQTVNQGFLQALVGKSVYPALRDRGVGLTFDGIGTISLPRRTAGGAGGGFVAEGSPIRVGRITTAAAELTPKKMGVIVPFSRELARRSTPAIEAIVRQGILEDTAAILDAALLDATASSTARPAGLLNGVSAAASGYGGGDHLAVKEDFKALLAPFISANAADNITVIMNPAQALSIAMMDGPDNNAGWFSGISGRVNIVESTYATAARLIAIRNSDFYTATGDAPEFDINETATVHMEDTTPLEIVSGTGPTTADPVRSFYQTATVGVRMLMDVSWVMGRPSMVQWIDGTSY
jgi:HK97 family phage major capsid protein